MPSRGSAARSAAIEKDKHKVGPTDICLDAARKDDFKFMYRPLDMYFSDGTRDLVQHLDWCQICEGVKDRTEMRWTPIGIYMCVSDAKDLGFDKDQPLPEQLQRSAAKPGRLKVKPEPITSYTTKATNGHGIGWSIYACSGCNKDLHVRNDCDAAWCGSCQAMKAPITRQGKSIDVTEAVNALEDGDTGKWTQEMGQLTGFVHFQ